MQQNTSNRQNHTPKYGKQFLQMLLGLIVAAGFAALWIGLCIDHTPLLVTGCITLALGILHVLIGYNNARHSFQNAMRYKPQSPSDHDTNNHQKGNNAFRTGHTPNRPYTPNPNRPYTPNPNRPYTPNPNRPHTPNYNRRPYAQNRFG